MNLTPYQGAVNIAQQYSNPCVTLALDWHTIDPRLPDSLACNLK